MQRKKIKKYYFLGISGIAMGTLAGMLKSKGHIVVGSDKEGIYPPMSDILNRLKIKVLTPYNKLHVKTFKPDIVVIGNTIKRGNPELEYIISNGLIYRSMSDTLREEVIESEDLLPIVITGTHGKTTTTALISWILEYSGLDPTVFCGGFIKNINSSFKLGNGKYIVIEGDEYTTSFWDKNPKFLHYRPYVGIINNIDHDHLDIYETLEDTKKVFSKFVNLIPESGNLIINTDNKNIKSIVKNVSCETFGIKSGNIIAKNINFDEQGTNFEVFSASAKASADKHKKQNLGVFHMKLPGEFNIYNALAAISTTLFLKIPVHKIKEAVSTFEGVSRRSEILGEKNGKIIINDFAHHPTAIQETLNGLRQMFSSFAKASKDKPKKRLIALFEPTSSSAKMKVMENTIIKALSIANMAFVYSPTQKLVSRSFTKAKFSSKINVSRNLENLLFHLKHETKTGDVIVMMTSKSFDGLKDKIWKVL